MPSVTIHLDDATLARLKQRARHGNSSIEETAGSLLRGPLEVDRFAPGAIEKGCKQLREVLARIPSTSNWRWRGVDHRHWWVSFRLDETNPQYVWFIGRLARILNTDALESWGYKPFVFTPELDDGILRWKIETLVSMVEPGEVAEYVEERLFKHK